MFSLVLFFLCNYINGNISPTLDTVDKIAATKTGAADKPVNDVVIESAETYIYEG